MRSAWPPPATRPGQADGGVHVSPPSIVGRPCASWSAVGRIGQLKAVESWFSYYNDDPANIRNIRSAGGGALLDVGCYCVNLSRMLFGSEPVGRQAAMQRDPRSRSTS